VNRTRTAWLDGLLDSMCITKRMRIATPMHASQNRMPKSVVAEMRRIDPQVKLASGEKNRRKAKGYQPGIVVSSVCSHCGPTRSVITGRIITQERYGH